jgi:hypothetical protein
MIVGMGELSAEGLNVAFYPFSFTAEMGMGIKTTIIGNPIPKANQRINEHTILASRLSHSGEVQGQETHVGRPGSNKPDRKIGNPKICLEGRRF